MLLLHWEILWQYMLPQYLQGRPELNLLTY